MVIGEIPVMHPYACIICGLGRGQRKWFIDLGFNLDKFFSPVLDGNIYVCNVCWESFTLDAERKIGKYLDEKALINDLRESESGEREPDSKGPIDFGPILDSSPTGDDQGSEPDDSELESANHTLHAIFGEHPSSLGGTSGL